MTLRLHGHSARRADISLGISVALIAATGVARALEGFRTFALLLLGLAAAPIVWRLLKGPFLGPAYVEITEDELVFTMPFYLPTRTARFPLERIRRLAVVGPEPGRRYRLELEDGRVDEVRPFFGPFLEPKARGFLRANLPGHIEIVESEPAGVLAQVRGVY